MKCRCSWLIAAPLLLAGCSAPERGQVMARHYEAPYTWIQMQCAGYNSKGICTAYIPIFHNEPERWILTLRDGDDEGDRAVGKAAYPNCEIGSVYPDCAEGTLRP